MLKILIVGMGSIAHKHISALDKIRNDFQYFALRSFRESTKNDRITDLFSWDDVPLDIAFAIISNPTDKHESTIRACLDRNISIFIEKPVSNRIGGLEELAKQFKARNLITYVGCNLRFLPVLTYLKQEISKNSKRINEVSVYCGSHLPDWRPNKDYRELYSVDETRGGGVHLDLFHEIDYVTWLLGLPLSNRGVTRSVSSLKINAADYANYILFYGQFAATITLNYFRRDAKRTIELVFEDTTWTVDLLKNQIIDKDANLIFHENFSIGDTYLIQMKNFMNVLNGSVKSENDMKYSVNILKIGLDVEKIS
ncbi:MAG: Gfo/Idh/MocA family oxidoreductase [Pedobacter sp.]|nr:Gfo/Idh/MocA family oxidoreductase [Pedobacter sp.]